MASNLESKDALTMAIENNPCGRCRAAGSPTCKCGGGGKGGSGGGDSGSDSGSKDKDDVGSTQTASPTNQTEAATIQKFEDAKVNFVQSQLFSDKTINYETELLSIDSDRLRGNLTLQIKSGLSKDDIEVTGEFLKTVKAEFHEFKNQLAEQGVSTQKFSAELKDDKLSLHIPNPKYYDMFIKHLDSKNLLPIPNPNRNEQKESALSAKEAKKDFNPTPFSTRLEKK